MRSLGRTLPALALLAFAAPAAAAEGASLTVPAGPGQQTLALRVEGGAIRAKACAAAAGCSADGGTVVAVPGDVKPRLGQAKVSVVKLAGGRAIAHVEVPGEAPGAAWRALVAAPRAGKGGEPLVIWSGATGVVRGEAGEERSTTLALEAVAGGGTRVLIGEHRADVTLCGRPALVGAREVDPATLSLARGASVQNLSVQERAGATKLKAARAPKDAPGGSRGLLHATGASSALGRRLAGITDGDLATGWSENKKGEGRGEFVSMSSADEVGITGLSVVVRPTEDLPEGAAPKRFYVATPRALFEVAMPEDAWKQPAGTRYTVSLPAEIRTRCLTVVLDESYAGASHAKARVTIAEIEARTAFDGATAEALAGALAGGGARSKAAAALLARSGEAGVRAAIGVYDKLDDQGKRLAAEVLDGAPCKAQSPFFAARMAALSAQKRKPGEVDPEEAHARDRLRRCGRAAAAALAKVIAEGAPRAKVAAAEELSAIAPDRALGPLLDAIAQVDDETRRDLRAALARAAKSRRAWGPLSEAVGEESLARRGDKVAIDLLRAIGPNVGKVEGAAKAFARIAAKDGSFRTRFLLQAPAAELAREGDPAAADYVRRALREDKEAHVRARAARVAGQVPALAADLGAAIDDADPRVREAAITALGEARAKGTPAASGVAASLAKRLGADDWTFVRAGAAEALGAMPADPAIDAALAKALGDRSPEVRGRAIDGLGAHRAKAHIEAIRERQDDDGERVEVRAHAILALGVLCDAESASAWTRLALIARAPISEADRRLGGAAVAALGELQPKDLKERLAPLLDPRSPVAVREMAKAALSAKGSCR
jgi:hypothetical protein